MTEPNDFGEMVRRAAKVGPVLVMDTASTKSRSKAKRAIRAFMTAYKGQQVSVIMTGGDSVQGAAA